MSSHPGEGLDSLLVGDTNEWTAALPRYQQVLINDMLTTHTPNEAAEMWLTSSGPKDTAPFGAVRLGPNMFYMNLLRELQKLFCGSPQYDDDRQSLLQAGKTGKVVLITGITASIAPSLGASAPVIVPAVALVLSVVANAANVTACEYFSSVIPVNDTPPRLGP